MDAEWNAYVLEHAYGVLKARSWHVVGGERVPWTVYRVIVDGRQAEAWLTRREARRALRRHMRAERRTRRHEALDTD